MVPTWRKGTFMALLIHLKKGRKIIINGAVLENASGRTASFLMCNEAELLRGEDVLPPDDALTPAGRVYYALQCLYLFPDRRPVYAAAFDALIEAFGCAAPSTAPLVARIRAAVAEGRYYDALKTTRQLIQHEAWMASALAAQASCANGVPGHEHLAEAEAFD
ncbi:MAG: flagellum biosynthesis protein FlbT [Rhodospirillales bacterium]|nr:MAG: flagellum biosynthesis protein FlbT [Rhodospirillales bacterium]